jgi:hypothetical protein
MRKPKPQRRRGDVNGRDLAMAMQSLVFGAFLRCSSAKKMDSLQLDVAIDIKDETTIQLVAVDDVIDEILAQGTQRIEWLSICHC